MLVIAREELEHFQMVHDIIKQRGLTLGRERKDHYVNELFKFMKKTEAEEMRFATDYYFLL